jgi:hypothetical protein
MEIFTRFITPLRDWYGRFERPISSLSLIGGFVFDAFTLQRIDRPWESFWLILHIVIVAVCMVWIHVQHGGEGDEADPRKLHFWLVNILQFFFGGLISAIIVFYFRSATLFVSWPFILLLILAFLANERLKRQFVRLSFQVALFFLSIYLCNIFLLPLIFHRLGSDMFLWSGLVSLALISVFLYAVWKADPKKYMESRRMILVAVFSIFAIMNVLYFTNLIPPIPLSLKDDGIYHELYREDDGSYIGTYEDLGWKGIFTLYDPVHLRPGDRLYAYSAVFSPSSLDVTVVHEWQHYDEATGKWKTTGTVQLPIVGGRDQGFRTYSVSQGLAAGKWRVNVKTLQGQVLGRMHFLVIPGAPSTPLSTKVR